MRIIFSLSLIVISNYLTAQDSSQHIVSGRVNSPEQLVKPYVILISADGFRNDLADKYRAKNLIRLRQTGVQADYLLSVFPSLTFPNHYSIATGDYPAHHGIVDNSFYDPARHKAYTMAKRYNVEDSSWYGATPIWVLAEKQAMLTASFYWVGTEAAIQGVRPTYSYKYNTLIPMNERIRVVRNWLSLPENMRPHLITFYIPDVDHEEHLHGVDSRQTATAVYYTDKAIGDLVRSIDSLRLPVNYIFLSDHGMTDIDTLHTIRLAEGIDTNHFIIVNSLSLVHLYAKDSADILTAYHVLKADAKDYDVYRPDELPSRWHYRRSDDFYHRIGDIILVSHAPKVFNFTGHHVNMATHGFDPAMPEMHATFYAWGPAFKQGFKMPGFENINIFPLITKILSLQNPTPVDGKTEVLEKVLRTY
jgi:predicted AlkP superfamily pyrophosphatase or phosphodiesterase